MDGGGGEHLADRRSLDRQLRCHGVEPMDGGRTRTPLSRARGLGSAKNGVEHWWMQRVTAVALVPLTLWFIASLMAIAGGDYGTVIAWFKRPLTTILMASLLTTLFHHMALGLRVVVEDYVHT